MVEVLDSTGAGLASFAPTPVSKGDTPGFGTLLASGFRLESDVGAVIRWASQDSYETDTTFDLGTAIDSSVYRFDYFNSLSKAVSQDHFTAIEAKIAGELKARQNIMEGGWKGMIAAGAGAIISPTMFIPFVGPARGLKGLGQATALAFAASGVNEAVLFAEQETRTPEEVLLGVASGTILGGLLGGAVKYIEPKTLKELEASLEGRKINERVVYDAMPSVLDDLPPKLTSPDYDITIPLPAFRLGVTKVGDDVVVYDPQGVPIAVRVQKADDEVVLLGEEGGEFTLGAGFTAHNPRSPDYKLQAEEGKARKIDVLTDTALVAQIDITKAALKAEEVAPETAVSMAAKQGEEAISPTVTALRQDLTALLTEAARRSENINPAVKEQARVVTPDGKPFVANDVNTQKIVLAGDEANRLPEARAITKGDLPAAIGGAAGAEVSSRALRPHNRLAKSRLGPVATWVNSQLSKINLINRLQNQKSSPVASFWASVFSDGGAILEGAQQGKIARAGGNVEARAKLHHWPMVQFIQEYDQAYAEYIGGKLVGFTEPQRAFWATASQRLGFAPEGKLTQDQFGKLSFDLANTGETYADATVMRAVKAQLDTYAYIKKVAEEAYQERRLLEGPSARRMFDPEGDLGPDLMNYAHHIYDVDAIAENPIEFQNLLFANSVAKLTKEWDRSVSKFNQSQVLEEAKLEAMEMAPAQRTTAIKESNTRTAEIESRPEVADYLTERGEAMTARREARANVRELTAKEPDGAGMTPDELQRATDDWDDAFSEATENSLRAEAAVKDIEANASITVKEGLNDIRTEHRFQRTITDTKGSSPAAIKRQKEKILKTEEEFTDRWRTKGATGISLAGKSADFDEFSLELAQDLSNRILGAGRTVSGMEILGGARGAALMRTLDLPWADKKKFIEQNPETVLRRYLHQMGPDVETYRATGSVNGVKIFEEMKEEFNTKQIKIGEAQYHKGKNIVPAGTAGATKVTPEWKAKAQKEALANYNTNTSDLNVMIERHRHQRGKQTNSAGYAYQAGRTALDWNVATGLGAVTIASIPDIGMPVLNYGVRRAFRDGLAPYFTNLKRVKATRSEARQAGIGLDPYLHIRTQELLGLTDNLGPDRSRLEKLSGQVSKATGLVAGFSRWTAEMKHTATAVMLPYFGETLEAAATGGKMSKKGRAFLSGLNIDDAMARRIWDQYNLPGGSSKIRNTARLPNTEAWTDMEVVTVFRQAMGQAADNTIVTPGLNRPAWVDNTMPGRLVAQFTSFGFSAVSKIIIPSLQRADAEIAQGVASLLGLGAMGVYLSAMSKGGRAQEEMENGDLTWWIDNSLERSGLLAIFSNVQRVAQNIPLTAPYATLSGAQTQRAQASGLIGSLAGPSFGLLNKGARLLQQINDPTASTIHTARTLVPYQNVFYLSRLFDEIENGVASATGIE